jgi:hypothetical protein
MVGCQRGDPRPRRHAHRSGAPSPAQPAEAPAPGVTAPVDFEWRFLLSDVLGAPERITGEPARPWSHSRNPSGASLAARPGTAAPQSPRRPPPGSASPATTRMSSLVWRHDQAHLPSGPASVHAARCRHSSSAVRAELESLWLRLQQSAPVTEPKGHLARGPINYPSQVGQLVLDSGSIVIAIAICSPSPRILGSATVSI